jgi:hypothetical protein
MFVWRKSNHERMAASGIRGGGPIMLKNSGGLPLGATLESAETAFLQVSFSTVSARSGRISKLTI